jgi:ketosteroid isomerase-like protein
MRRALAVLLLLSGCASARPPEDAVATFTAAFNRLSADELRPLLAEDATAYLPMPQFGARLEGREAIVAALGPLFEAEKARGSVMNLQAKALSVQRAGGAVVATFDVGTEAVFSRRTLVLERRGGAWRIVHLHASNVRPVTATGAR